MKKRVIPSLLLNSGTQLCLSQKFKPWRSVGSLMQNLRMHVNREADELLIINLDYSTCIPFAIPLRLLQVVRNECDIPVSYCGGIRSASDAAFCINEGVDKVYVTSVFIDNQDSIKSFVDLLGSQSIGVSLPYVRCPSLNAYFVWDYRSKTSTGLPLQKAIQKAVSAGAGELLLHNVDLDGSMQGMDLELLDELACDISVPILMAGGAGSQHDISIALSKKILSGVVVGSMFALTENTPTTVRAHCLSQGLPMRIV